METIAQYFKFVLALDPFFYGTYHWWIHCVVSLSIPLIQMVFSNCLETRHWRTQIMSSWTAGSWHRTTATSCPSMHGKETKESKNSGIKTRSTDQQHLGKRFTPPEFWKNRLKYLCYTEGGIVINEAMSEAVTWRTWWDFGRYLIGFTRQDFSLDTRDSRYDLRSENQRTRISSW